MFRIHWCSARYQAQLNLYGLVPDFGHFFYILYIQNDLFMHFEWLAKISIQFDLDWEIFAIIRLMHTNFYEVE